MAYKQGDVLTDEQLDKLLKDQLDLGRVGLRYTPEHTTARSLQDFTKSQTRPADAGDGWQPPTQGSVVVPVMNPDGTVEQFRIQLDDKYTSDGDGIPATKSRSKGQVLEHWSWDDPRKYAQEWGSHQKPGLLDKVAEIAPSVVATYFGGPMAGGAVRTLQTDGNLGDLIKNVGKAYVLQTAGNAAGDWAAQSGLGDAATGAVKGFVGSGGNPLGAVTGGISGALSDTDFMAEDARRLAEQGLSQSQIADIMGQTYGSGWETSLAQTSGAIKSATKGFVDPLSLGKKAVTGAISAALPQDTKAAGGNAGTPNLAGALATLGGKKEDDFLANVQRRSDAEMEQLLELAKASQQQSEQAAYG